MFKSLLLKGRTLGLLLCCLVSSLAVTAQVKHTGKVIGSDDKLPVVGASIRIKGTNTGAVTDVNGDFTLALSPGNVLVVSYIGYVTQEVTVRGGEFLTISLAPASSTLNEVVVTGYQTQVKKDITGAVGLVDVQDAKKLEVNSSEQLLQGQVSGVSVINDGAPGSPSTVFIRGISNFGVTNPLYVIDGVQTSSMSELSPSDIESIAVLKDAGAAAIYGVSGGNGVIVITTKHGKAGKTQLTYDAFFADQTPLSGNVFHLMDPTQQSILTYQADDPSASVLYPGGPGVLPTYGYHGGTSYSSGGTNFGSSGVTDNSAILGAYHYDASNASNDFLVQKFDQQGTDWFHAIFKDAPEQRQTITASGGTDHSTFLYSLDYLNDEGTLIETFEKRYSARLNNTYSLLNNHLRFGESGYVYYENNNGGYNGDQQNEGGSISYAYRAMPIIPVYDVQGNFGGTYDGPSGEPLGNGQSPVQIQDEQANQFSKNENIQGLVFAEADIAKYFTVRTAFGGNYNSFAYNGITTIPYEAYESHANPTGYNEVDGYSSSFNFTNTLNYKETFGKSAVTAFAGYEIREYQGQQLGVTDTNLPFLTPSYLTVATTTAPNTVNLSNSTYIDQPNGTESVFGRVDYAYDDKYLLSGTVRRDGFSAFYPGKQWGTFPSATAGWRVSKEDFMKGISWIQDLKLRGSFGESGSNANIKANSIYNTYSSGFGSSYYGIGGGLSTITPGYQQASIGNPNTTWETDKVLDVGVDASLFNHLDFSLDYYKKQSTDLLFGEPLPATAGGALSPIVNDGSVQNTGFDFSATYHDAIGALHFSITGNLTSYKSLITSLPDGSIPLFAGNRIGNPFVQEAVGEPIGEFYGYKVQGIYQNTAQLTNGSVPMESGASVGSYIYQAQGNDKTITSNDETYIGNPNPDFTYGLNLNASYKGFDFSMVLYGSQGNKDFNYVKWWTDTYQSFPGGKQLNLLTDAAIVQNGQVTNPGATLQANSVNIASPPSSSFYVENGSFLKCRVLSIGYNLDPGILRTIGISKLHLYVQGTNLFTITKYTGLDPELLPSVSNQQSGAGSYQSASTGVDWGAYPTNQKVFSLGVNATL
jgi:TonB-linked SusC/RagA family outer membrane protein